MSDISQRIAALSPKKRALLALQLKQKGNLFNSFPLSFAQQRLWFLDQLEPGDPSYNIVSAVHLEGHLNVPALEASFNEIVRRHESLRTIFATIEGQPVQIVQPAAPLRMPLIDLSEWPETSRTTEAMRVIAEESARPFDLSCGPLLRHTLLQLQEGEYVALLVMHHIISDGWSVGVLLREVATLYEAFSEQRPSPLPDLPIQYVDFAQWQRQWLQGEFLQKQLDYWKTQLGGSLPMVELPMRNSRPAQLSHRGAQQSLALSSALYHDLKALSQREGTTLFMTLLAVFNVLLHRYSGQEDIVVGTPIAGRDRADTEDIIGFFVNSLVLRADLSGNPTFRQFLGRVREISTAAFTHQYLPFERLVEELTPERSLSHSPLFQVMFALQNAPMPSVQMKGLKMSALEIASATAKFDLTLDFFDSPEAFLAIVVYNTDLYESQTIDRMIGHLRTLLAAAAANPLLRLAQLPLLTPDERQQLLTDFHQRAAHPPGLLAAHQWFDAQADRTPDAVALAFQHQQLSFAALEAAANRLAHRLLAQRLPPEARLGLCLPRGLQLVIAILGVLKAGAAYLPLEADYPAARLRLLCADADLQLIITEAGLADYCGSAGCRLLLLEEASGGASRRPALSCSPGQLAYLIYTSGTSGQPKAVMVEHGQLAHTLEAAARQFPLQATDAMLMMASAAFDISLLELLLPLLAGARVEMLSKDEVLEVAGLSRRLQEVSLLHAVPGLMQQIVEQARREGRRYRQIRRAFVGGEAVPVELLRQMGEVFEGAAIEQLYGPTEATIICVSDAVRGEEEEAGQVIGRPMSNVVVRVCDGGGELAGVGVRGEICIGGGGVTRGYLGRAEQTAERYVPDGESGRGGARLYRSGDLGRYLADGRIEYLGRGDRQVKVRGHRIELGEIESVLRGHPGVRECVVEGRGAGGQQRLVGYVVKAGEGVSERQMREYLKERLPEYMQVGVYVEMGEMPLTANGKVDRRRLPEAGEVGGKAGEYEEASSQVEQELVRIWGEVLGVKRVGVRDNFFEMGGDSILSIQVVARAAQVGLQISPRQMFQQQTVAELAQVAQVRGVRGEAGGEEMGAVSGAAALTPIQRWFFEQEVEEGWHYNQAVMLEGRQEMRGEWVGEVYGALVEQHDALRLRFREREGVWEQEVEEAAEARREGYTEIDLREVSDEHLRGLIEAAAERVQRSLDLERGPMARLCLFTVGDGKAGEGERSARGGSRVLMVIHHLGVDGVSWRVLLEDLQLGYEQMARGEGVRMLPATLAYTRWAERLAEYAQSAEIGEEIGYWQRQAEQAVGRLPVAAGGGPGEASQRRVSGLRQVRASLSQEETRRLLVEVPGVYQTQIDEVLLSGLGEVLCQWAGCERLEVEMEGHGREVGVEGWEVSRTVGWFTSIYPVVVERREGEGVGERLKRVKEEMRRIPGKGSGYGVLKYLREEEGLRQRISRESGAEVLFNYLGQLDQVMEEGGLLRAAGESSGSSRSGAGRCGHRIEINSWVMGGRLEVEWSYSEGEQEEATMAGLATAYVEELRRVIGHGEEAGAGGYTVSDFAMAGLSQEELEAVVGGRRDIQDIYPLTPMQEGMLFHTQLAPQSGMYLTQLSCELVGEIDVAAFGGAWEEVVRANAVLRSGFASEGLRRAVQVVSARVKIEVEEKDWREKGEQEQEQEMREYLGEERRRGFELQGGPLMRLSLVRLGEQKYQFIWTHHHLLLDGWSLPLVMGQLLTQYHAISEGSDHQLRAGRPFRDYIAWLQKQDVEEAKNYWRTTLSQFTEPTRLPFDRDESRRIADSVGNTSRQEASLSMEITAELYGLARKQQVTLSTIIQGAWAILLSRYSGDYDVVFGMVVSGRPAELPGVERMVGLFINTLPVRLNGNCDQQVVDWLKEIQQRQVEMRRYEYSPLVDVQGCSGVPLGTPLFNSILAFENYPVDSILRQQLATLDIRNIQTAARTNFPISVVVQPGDQLKVIFNYDNRQFEEATIERMSAHFQTALHSITNPLLRVSQIQILTEPEKQQLLVEWNNTDFEYSKSSLVHHLFETQAELRPDALALIFEAEQLTYRELNRRANQLARRLRAKGVGPEVVVGVFVEQSLDVVIAVLGILKAGGAYLGMDPALPKERLAFMLEDGHAPILLTQTELLSRLPEHSAAIVCLDALGDEIAGENESNPTGEVQLRNLAYVIYTSGSTGKPKGVACDHWQLLAYLTSVLERVPYEPKHSYAMHQTLAVDAPITFLWASLCTGGILHILSRATASDGHSLGVYFQQNAIDYFKVAPTHFRALMGASQPEHLMPRDLLMLGGEACDWNFVESLQPLAPACKIINHYGPTETTVGVITYDTAAGRMPGQQMVSLGRPLANTQVYLLDAGLDPVPIGIYGDLYVGGEELARGYLNRPGLTAERFIANPYGNQPATRLYKTGDLARYLPDGNIEFLGRADHQIKIRGFRIEIGEIEAALKQHRSVKEAVVIVHEDQSGDKRLIAYLVASAEAAILTSELRSFLGEKLPVYMVPSAYVILETLPRTPQGKINRQALPAPEMANVQADKPIILPRTPMQEILAGIWSEVVGVEQVGIYDSFFELGGHSLLATRLISRVREAFRVELPLRSFFDAPTIAGLSGAIEAALLGEQYCEIPPIVPVSRHQPLPLSFAQQRLWFLSQLDSSSPVYNVHVAVRLKGSLDVVALGRSLEEVVNRHEVLRTTFATIEGHPVQVITAVMAEGEDTGHLRLPVIDLREVAQSEREAEALRLSAAQGWQAFDLAIGPLVRTRLLHVAEDEYMLLVTMHHIISDGWSSEILVREIGLIYEAFSKGEAAPLNRLPIQYADFAQWQRQWLQGEVLESQLAYWMEQLSDSLPLLELPLDRPRPMIPTFRGARQNFRLPQPLSHSLKTVHKREGVTLFMTLLTAFEVLLYRYTGLKDIIIGTPSANRNRREIEDLIGFFANTLVLRTDLTGDTNFKQVLRRVRDLVIEAYAHQHLPFEKLVEALNPERVLNHNPIFQVVFVFQNAVTRTLELPGLTLNPIESDIGTAKFDLILVMQETADEIIGSIEYSTDLYDASSIERMAEHFKNLLEGIVANPQQRLGDLPMLSPRERHQLLVEWNPPIELPVTACLHQLFDDQARLTPDAIAATCQQQQLSYGHLAALANHLAHHLLALGVAAESLVALLLDPSLDTLVAILGVLKAGAAYLPLEVDYPASRLAYLLADSGAALLISTRRQLATHSLPPLRVICLDDLGEMTAASRQPPVVAVCPQNAAYVIYTSGSTGKPKGVVVTHANVVRLFAAAARCFTFSEADVWTLCHSYAFDFSVWEMWGGLLAGGRVVVVEYWERREPQRLYEVLESERVSVLNQTPSSFAQLMRVDEQREGGLRGLRYVIFGGEELGMGSLRGWMERHGEQEPELVNMYGITETTVHVSHRRVKEEDVERRSSMVGGGLADMQMYVMGESGEMQVEGVRGEIVVGGGGLARGYLGRAEQTAARFVPDGESGRRGARLYRSGDLGRYKGGRDVEYGGRGDQQVKVRGYRIELGEVRAAVMQEEGVRECVVVMGEVAGGRRQVEAYVVMEGGGGGELRMRELRKRLKEELPDYMVPGVMVEVEEVRLTRNGKVDVKRMREEEATRVAGESEEGSEAGEYEEASSQEERELVRIWGEVLGVKRIGVRDNFFELGGDSIRSVQVIAKAQQRGISFSVQDVFLYQTIAEIAKRASYQLNPEAATGLKTEAFCLISEDDRIRLPLDIEDAYPLTRLQAGMIFHSEASPDTSMYHNLTSFHLQARFDLESMRAAIQQLMACHPVLRTSFDLTTFSEPLQVVYQSVDVPLQVEDLSHLSPSDQNDRLAAWIKAETRNYFDKSKPPLVRFHIHLRGEQEFQFSLTEHHAILDGWSVASMVSELFQRYFSLLREEASFSVTPISASYRDFVALERQALKSEESMQFWADTLNECTAMMMPRMPQPVMPADVDEASSLEVPMSTLLFNRLKDVANAEGVSLKSVLLTAHIKVMSMVSGLADLVTGLVSSGRPEQEGSERILGLFLNTIPFRIKLKAGTWAELIRETFEVEGKLLAYRWYPLAEIQKLTGGRSLFETAFNYIHFHVYESVLKLQSVRLLDGRSFQKTNFTFMASFKNDPSSSKLQLVLEYDSSQLYRDQLRRIGDYYVNALEAIAANSLARHHAQSLLMPHEMQQIIVDWNDTATDYEQDQFVHQIIESQVLLTPDRIALSFDNACLSYLHLNRRANQLAHCLAAAGTAPDSLVGICATRSLDLVIAILGVLKAGAAYLPLEPSYPPDRLRFMLEDAQVHCLLTQAAHLPQLPEPSPPVICLDRDWQALSRYASHNPSCRLSPDNLAYVIYTSGSTGQPKAVPNTHGGLRNRLLWMQATYGLEAETVLQKTPFSFDVSVWEFLWPLMVGGRLAVAVAEGHKDADYLVEVIQQQQVSIVHFVPSMLQAFVEAVGVEGCVSLREVICSGEALPYEYQERFYEKLGCGLNNLYGPTEAAIDVTSWRCEAGGERQVPLGRPIANTQIYVMDVEQEVVGVGIRGEIYIGGVGLARGYLGRAEMTAARFVPDGSSGRGGARLYRSGDLGRYLADGRIEYLGRGDRQVKVRGHRIELGEIESVLRGHPGVRECVVEGRGAGGQQRLVGYVVKAGERIEERELRKYLKERLPEYMQVGVYVEMGELPLTSNGKVDRRRLPEVGEVGGKAGEYEEASSRVEQELVRIWGEVLGVKRVGVRDNFFEMGGDSILSIQVVARAAAVGLQISPRQLFQQQTVRELAQVAQVRGARGEAGEDEMRAVSGAARLTPIQRWFFEQEVEEGWHYNQAVMLEGRQEMRGEWVEEVYGALVDQHDALRLRFREREEVWEQEVEEAAEARREGYTEIDLREVGDEHLRGLIEAAAERVQRSLDLERGPMARLCLFVVGDGETSEGERSEGKAGARGGSRVLMVIHHLGVDGVSWRVLLEDLQLGYEQLARGEGVRLLPATLAYTRWAERLVEYAQSAEIGEEIGYWQRQAEQAVGRLPVAEGGGPGEASQRRVSGLRQVRASLSQEETRRLLVEVPGVYQTQIDEVLLSGLGEVLCEWAGCERLEIEMEGHGREVGVEGWEVSRTVGWFTSIYPVVVERREGEGVGERLKRVKEEMRRIPGKGSGYGVLKYLREEEGLRQRISRESRAEVLFNYLGQLDQVMEEGGLLRAAGESSGGSRSGAGRRRHRMEINSWVMGGRLEVEWSYSEGEQEEATMAQLAAAYVEELRRVIGHGQEAGAGGYTVSDFEMAGLSQEELEAVVGDRRDIQDIYPLTPAQQGMLFHSLFDPASGVYVSQYSCTVKGELNISAFERAWQQVIDRHNVFRTAFTTDITDTPLQVVYKNVKLMCEQQDWRGLDSDEQGQRRVMFLQADKDRGFDMSTAPLMRFTLIRTGEIVYEFVWSHHHLLLDGWSISLVFKEFFTFFEAYCKGQDVYQETARSYRLYIAWLAHQDMAKAEVFWRRLLVGFTKSTPLPYDQDAFADQPGKLEYDMQQIRMSSQSTSEIKSYAKQHQLTLNTLVQGAWSLLLSHYSGHSDVVFGIVTSGRPAYLTGSDSMIGLFISNLPVRAQLVGDEQLLPWLRRLQDQQAEILEYEYTPLNLIHRWSAVAGGESLFHSNLVFENYPMQSLLRDASKRLELDNIKFSVQANYPITLTAMPGSELLLQLEYNRGLFSAARIEQMLGHLDTLLRAFSEQPNRLLSSLSSMLDDADAEQRRLQEKELEQARVQKFKRLKRRKATE